jgi:hypothetical protein
MSFEVEYDPISQRVTSPEPVFTEPQAAQEAPVADEMVENQGIFEQEMVENQPSESEEAPVAPKQHVESSKPAPQESWKLLREKAEQAQKRALELERQLQEERNRNQPQEYDDEDYSLDPDEDELVEGKHLSKYNKKINNLESKLAQYEQQATLSRIETQIKKQYSDFDQVVSTENLANLRTMYPELMHSIDVNQDIYSKAVSAYTMIKKLGIEEAPTEYSQNKELAHRNSLKPKPSAALSPQKGDTPLSRANAFAQGELTPELKAQMLQEMNKYRNY